MIAAKQIFLGKSGKHLPYDAEVDYIESTGVQFIDTGVSPDSAAFRFRLDGAFTSVNVNSAHGTYMTDYRAFIAVIASRSIFQFGEIYGAKDSVAADTNRHVFDWNWNRGTTNMLEFSIDGNLEYSDEINPTPGLSSNITFYVFARHGQSGAAAKAHFRCYGVVLEKDGQTEFDAMPVRVGNAGCLYDHVSGQVFLNAGTGAFLYGNDK